MANEEEKNLFEDELSTTVEEKVEETVDTEDEDNEDEVVDQGEAINEVSNDDFSDKAPSDNYKKITPETEIPKDLVLTIESVEPQQVYPKNFDGTPNEPLESSNGKYYKSKLIVKFKEEIMGVKVRELLPSIFRSVDDNGVIASPRIPKACDDEDLDDNFTSELAKVRNKYCKFVNKDPSDVSDRDFVKGMIGKKVKISKETGKYNGKKWAKLKFEEFVK